MSYKGRELTAGNYLKLDDIQSQFNGSTTTFNLTSGGTAFYPGSAFSIQVVLGGVIQEPESAYVINQSQITFAAAPGSVDDFFCIALGVSLGIGVPGEGTVTGTKLSKPFSYDDGLLVLDSTNNFIGLNSTTPTVALDVVGNVKVSGVVTATNLISQSLVVSGITTFTNGPVLVGTATSTGTASQLLQVTGGAYVSGNLGIGTTNSTSKLSVEGGGNFTGVVTATAFYGNGSNLTSLAGMGTAVSTSGFGADVFFTNSIGYVTETTTLSSPDPSSSPILYTRYEDIVVSDGVDLIIGNGNELFTDVLQLSQLSVI